MFDASDTTGDKDGLSLEEWVALAKLKYPQISEDDVRSGFEGADHDNDGKVSWKEFRAYAARVLK